MKKLTLSLASALLAIACVANAENCVNSATAKNDSNKTVVSTETHPAPSRPLTSADFRLVKGMVDFNFQRMDSIRLVALKCHMNVDHVNRLFNQYAHQDAEKYLANLKRNFNAATHAKNVELAARQTASSWPDPYIIGR
ncbi:MAG TPA: hypothetical protein VGO67_20570 [Verrucomicrobiae bacterium]|jgi:hypothetical protein